MTWRKETTIFKRLKRSLLLLNEGHKHSEHYQKRHGDSAHDAGVRGRTLDRVSERCIKQKECVYGTCDKFLSLLIREKCLVHLRVVARQPHPRVMICSPVISCLPASSCSASSSESFSPRVVSKWRSSALVIRPFPS